MKKFAITILVFFIFLQGFSQNQRKFSGYIKVQYNTTLYDYGKEINPWGAGLGFQGYMNNEIKFKPTLDITADLYMADNFVKIMFPIFAYPKDSIAIDRMINVFVGSVYKLNDRFNISLTAGPSFIDDRVYIGIKPTVEFYYPKAKNFSIQLSYINIFNRLGKNDFGTFSISSGIKLF